MNNKKNKKYMWVGIFLFLMFATSIFVAASQLHSIQTEFSRFYNHPNFVRVASNRLKTQLESVQKNLLFAATADTIPEANAYIDTAVQAATDARKEFDVINERFVLGDTSKVEKLGKQLEGLSETRDEIIELIKGNQSNKAILLLKTGYGTKAAAVSDTVQYFIDFSQQKGDQLLNSLSSGLITLPFVLIGVTVFIFIIFTAFLMINQKRHVKELEKIAYYDELTGLPNLVKFKIDAAQIVADNKNNALFVVEFDISNFKMVNTMFNFEVGNEIIKTISDTLTRINREQNVGILEIARITADQFIFIGTFDLMKSTENHRALFEKAFTNATSNMLGNHKISFKYGRYIIENDEKDIERIVEKVHLAHEYARLHKKVAIFDYDSKFKEQLVEEVNLSNRMGEALENEEFKMYLQPKFHLQTEEIIGAEALVRWQQADGGLIAPIKFIPLFEKNGFIEKLDMYMLKKACMTIKRWLNEGKEPIAISVNFSKLHLDNPSFVDEICSIIDSFGIHRKYIEVEITESTMVDNEDEIVKMLDKLHDEGISISMDDFGAGYSSLGLLKNMPLDVLKMDRGFLTDFKNRTTAKAVVESVLGMAKKIKVDTVAEGVETKEHVALLKELGCDIAQGYYYSKPVTVSEFEKGLVFKELTAGASK